MNLAIIFGIAVLLLLLPDAYIVFSVMHGVSWWLRGLFLMPTLFFMIVVIRIILADDLTQTGINLLFWLTLTILFPILIFTLVSLFGRFIGLFWHPASVIFNWTALALGIIWLCGAIYGITAGWKKVEIVKETIVFPSLPSAFNGYKIVHLSDFHIGTYNSSPETVEKIVRDVNSLNPDLIVFTGDLVNNSPDEITPFSKLLSQFRAKDGVISILGNHDYCLYRRYQPPYTPQKALNELTAKESEAGWKLLRNEAVQIRRGNDSIAVIGVENAGDKHFINKSDLKKALAGIPADEFKILLSHDPTHWRREVLPKTDIDLTLSGHTHGMQFEIGGFSPAQWTYPEWGGLYKEGPRALYVSTGVGGNVAFRFGIYPHIVLLTLKK